MPLTVISLENKVLRFAATRQLGRLQQSIFRYLERSYENKTFNLPKISNCV